MANPQDMHITPPASLRRTDAARYCGISPSHFDRVVRESVMPAPHSMLGTKVWLRRELDDALFSLAVIGEEMEGNSCDAAFGMQSRAT